MNDPMTREEVATHLGIEPESVRSTMRRHGITRGYPRDAVLALSQQKKRLTAADVGAWVFKCDPKVWDVTGAMAAGVVIHAWRAVRDYRLELITAGQPAVLWVSGSSGATPEPGIWMTGFTTGEIGPDQGDEYWFDDAERNKLRPYVGVSVTPLDPIVPRARVAADRRTRDMEVLRCPRRGNPSYLTHVEKAVVWEMIGGGYGE